MCLGSFICLSNVIVVFLFFFFKELPFYIIIILRYEPYCKCFDHVSSSYFSRQMPVFVQTKNFWNRHYT